MRIDRPCLYCEDRHELCHSNCEKYIEFCAKVKERRHKIKKGRTEYAQHMSFKVKGIEKRKQNKKGQNAYEGGIK